MPTALPSFTVRVWDSENNADDPLSHPQTFYITSTGCRNTVKHSAYGCGYVIFDYCFIEWLLHAYKVIAV